MYTHVCVLSYLLVLSVYGGTWVLDLSGAGASPAGFFFFWDWSLPTGPPSLEWTSFPFLVTAVLITPKGAEPPDSRRIGEIGALVYYLPPETV